MENIKSLLACLTCLLMSSLAVAHAVDNSVTTIADNDSVASSSTKQWTFPVPTVTSDQQVRISLDARIDWPNMAGSTLWMRIAINGKYLTRPALLNKPFLFDWKNEADLAWATDDQWRVIYAPDFVTATTKDYVRAGQFAVETLPVRMENDGVLDILLRGLEHHR